MPCSPSFSQVLPPGTKLTPKTLPPQQSDILDSISKSPGVELRSRHAQAPNSLLTAWAGAELDLVSQHALGQGSLSQHIPPASGHLLDLTWERSLQLLQIPQNFLAQQVNEAGHDLGR